MGASRVILVALCPGVVIVGGWLSFGIPEYLKKGSELDQGRISENKGSMGIETRKDSHKTAIGTESRKGLEGPRAEGLRQI